MAKIATDKIRAGEKSDMKEVLDKGGTITSETILEYMLKGDQFAYNHWHQTCRYIAIGCINVDHVINSEIIVLAGGMIAAGHNLLQPVRKYYRELQGNVFGPCSGEIVLAQLGNDAGFVGAAGAAKLSEETGEFKFSD